MAELRGHKHLPEGRRHPAPPRRLPRPANDNLAPGHGRRVLRAAILATLIAFAATAATVMVG
ncbi:MAG: hypothetical protein AB1918_18290 [Pseudomonadota bacterium]